MRLTTAALGTALLACTATRANTMDPQLRAANLECVEPVPSEWLRRDRDLAITLERVGTGAIEPGETFAVRAFIRNGARADDRLVVLPPGAHVGVQVPMVEYEAFVQPHGSDCATRVRDSDAPFCGVTSDDDWHEDVVALAPGGSREMLVPDPAFALALGDLPAGELRIFLRYMFSGDERPLGQPGMDLGPMKNQRAFEIVSNAIVLEIERPLELELAPRRDRDRDRIPTTLADLFTLTVRNVGTEMRSVAHVDAARLFVEVEGDDATLLGPSGGAWSGGTRVEPGTSTQLPLDAIRWARERHGEVRVRVRFCPYGGEALSSVEITSNWATITI